jgi:heme o synthase
VIAHAMTLRSSAADLIALTKPRLSTLVMVTMLCGMWVAPGGLNAPLVLMALLCTAAVVGAANALNCYIERDSDRLMARTRNRPLPSGRMDPKVALWFGVTLAVVSLPPLYLAVNPLTGLLGTIAFLSYVLVYTPLKRRTSAAMLVGAVPGALPPLMGWTAVTGRLELPGLVLFAILFLWQIPHSIAIGLFRADEYAAAGIRVLPVERGEGLSRALAVAYLVPLVAISVLPFTLELAGWIYLTVAAVLGSWFLWTGFYGLIREGGKPWARQLFFVSLIYLTGIFVAMAVDLGPNG